MSLVLGAPEAFGAAEGSFAKFALIGAGVAGLAAMNLVIDFDMIERIEREKMPAHMEWFGALGLTVTLVWLYLEILRLLAKLQDRR